MPDKQTIIDNISQYPDDKLVKFVIKGIVTMEDLNEAGEEFPAKRRKEIKKLLNAAEEQAKAEESYWLNAIETNSSKTFQKYIERYPDGKHVDEARTLIAQMGDDDDWNNSKETNTIKAYQNYIQKYPNGKHVEEAEQSIAIIEKEEANKAIEKEWRSVNRTSICDLEEFRTKHPDFRADEIADIINDLKCDKEWENTDKSDIEALERFIDIYPESKYASSARQAILDIQSGNTPMQRLFKDIDEKIAEYGADSDDRIIMIINRNLKDKSISKLDFLKALRKDSNRFKSTLVNKFVDKGIFSYPDLLEAGFDSEIIRLLQQKATTVQLPAPNGPLTEIKNLSTEVYFWGLPSSGKSCALGSILSVASDVYGFIPEECQGLHYMDKLATLFSNNYSRLPQGTDTGNLYEMAFILTDDNNQKHPITCIDLAGEVIRAMYWKDAGKKLDDSQESALNSFNQFFFNKKTKSKNQKVHFFVLDYSASEKIIDGLSQLHWLQGAMKYIKKTDVFKDNTDAIYLIITKVDKFGVPNEELQDCISDFIRKKYRGFYKTLQVICKDFHINNGKVEVFPFTLGEVFFQDYCKFNKVPANVVLKHILARSWVQKDGVMHKISNL